jgi:hypothetical protein
MEVPQTGWYEGTGWCQPDLAADLARGAAAPRTTTGPGRTGTGRVGGYPADEPTRTILDMTKRIVAALLWFYAGWYAGAIMAEFIGVSPVLGPLIGAAAAGLIAGDPRRLIWKRPATPVVASTSSEAMPEPA